MGFCFSLRLSISLFAYFPFQMLPQDLAFCKTLNPSVRLFHFASFKPLPVAFRPKPIILELDFRRQPGEISESNGHNATCHRDIRCLAGRSNKKPGGSSSGRIEGSAEIRRRAKLNARRKSKQLAESLFYRLKNPNKNQADNFTEEELEMIGLGYDRMVRFMEKDDPNIRHPYDWFKYGQYGPYSWRGVVVGDPISGRFSDERVTMIGEVRNHEEWEKIEQFEMEVDFSERLKLMDKSVGFRYFWVFVRHPKWKLSDLPWQQWTLVSEVVLEAGKQRLDKWSLMGRLGNKARSLITQCAAWFRPDIIYVKRPVYQCRFEPQDQFFRVLTPYLDPKTEGNYLFDLKREDGSVDLCTYFEGLCKIVRVSPKAFVDDVVNAYEKLSDENKSRCLEFLLANHPLPLLHPYTKEWKTKLEEMELGCDAPDDDEEVRGGNEGEVQFTDWVEDDGDGNDDSEDHEDDYQDDMVVDVEGGGDDELGVKEEEESGEEDENYWEEQFKKAVSSAEAMENLVKRSVEVSTEFYKEQLRTMEKQGKVKIAEDGDETAMRGKRAKVSPEEWKIAGFGKWRRRIKKSKIPPQLFLKAAVRPFTYRNLVKEIVLTRHAILEGEIGRKE